MDKKEILQALEDVCRELKKFEKSDLPSYYVSYCKGKCLGKIEVYQTWASWASASPEEIGEAMR